MEKLFESYPVAGLGLISIRWTESPLASFFGLNMIEGPEILDIGEILCVSDTVVFSLQLVHGACAQGAHGAAAEADRFIVLCQPVDAQIAFLNPISLIQF